MNKRDKNKRLKGFGIPVELCVRYAYRWPASRCWLCVSPEPGERREPHSGT